MAHKARKRFGQNFLVDRQVIAEIIDIINPQPEDRMVEIGPGLGALTRPLMQTLDHLIVIELDRDIVERLKMEFPQDKLTIYSADALKFDFLILGENLRIIGNLPYNISTPLLFYLIHNLIKIKQPRMIIRVANFWSNTIKLFKRSKSNASYLNFIFHWFSENFL